MRIKNNMPLNFVILHTIGQNAKSMNQKLSIKRNGKGKVKVEMRFHQIQLYNFPVTLDVLLFFERGEETSFVMRFLEGIFSLHH